MTKLHNLRPEGIIIAFILLALSVGMVGWGQYRLDVQPQPLDLVFRAGGPIRSSPVIDLAKNAIYFGADDGNLYAIPLMSSEQPRKPKWVFSPDPEAAKRRPMRATPMIDEVRNRIYIGADDGNLYAVDRDTGTRVETFAPERRSGAIRVPPALDLQMSVLYVGADDGRLIALNVEDGKIARFSTPIFLGSKGPLRTAPVVDYVKSAIYFGSDDGGFYAVDREDLFYKRFEIYTGGPVRGSPSLDLLGGIDFSYGSEAAIYFGSDNGSFYAVDRAGNNLYIFVTQGPVRTTAIADPQKNAVYFVSDDGNLYALFRLDEINAEGEIVHRAGTQKFRTKIVAAGAPIPFDSDWTRSSPVLDRRLGASGTGTIIVGSVDGNLYGIDPDSGEIRFIHPVPEAGSNPQAAIRTTPALFARGPGELVDIYVGADDGGLYVITRRP